MNTILTDDEIHKWWASENGMEDADMAKLNDFREVTRKVEAAVLAKLREQEPVAQPTAEMVATFKAAFESGSIWTARVNHGLEQVFRTHKLYAAPQPAVVQVQQGWPTNEMIEAGRKAALSHGPLLGNGQSLWHIFRDMLAAAPEAPAQGSTWMQRNAVFVITEAYEAGVGKGMQAAKRGEEVQNPWGDEPCREAWALGYKEGKKRYRPEARAIPAPWREAVKVAREALDGLAENAEAVKWWLDADLPEGSPVHPLSSQLTWPIATARAALAQLDSLGGGK